MDDYISSAELSIAVENLTPLFKKGVVQELIDNPVTWDQIINSAGSKNRLLQAGMVQQDPIVPGCITLLRSYLLQNFTPRTNDATIHVYCSFCEGAETYGTHKDTANVWFVGAIGKTKFEILEEEYIIEPGDILFIPRSVYHTPIPLEARAGFSIGLEHGRHD
jgi:mannose-6-phosphate isomerase-like protein (cupin superfamily)